MNNIISQERIEIPEREVEPKSLQEFYQEVDVWIMEQIEPLHYTSLEEPINYALLPESKWHEEALQILVWMNTCYELVDDGERDLNNLITLNNWLQENQN